MRREADDSSAWLCKHDKLISVIDRLNLGKPGDGQARHGESYPSQENREAISFPFT